MKKISIRIRGISLKASLIVASVSLSGLIVVSALAAVGVIFVSIKPGDPVELVADGKSRTRLVLDHTGCPFLNSGDPEDLIQMTTKTNLGVLDPISMLLKREEISFPMELTFVGGTKTGTATISVTMFYCPKGGTMVFGQCTDPEAAETSCVGDIKIPILEASASEASASEDETSEDSKDLAVSLGCQPSSPKVGESISCTATASGVKEGEELEYQWSLEGRTGARGKERAYSWKGDEAGHYEVSVDVFGDARTTSKTIRVLVAEGEGSKSDEEVGNSPTTEDVGTPDLVRSLEAFLGAAGLSGLDPARVAAAGGAAAVLITAWVIINHRAGVPMGKLEQALGQWRWRVGQDPGPVKAETPKEVPEQIPEAEKIGAGVKKPTSIPEQGEISADAGVQASASAQIDEPEAKVGVEAQYPGALAAGARALSGESGEECVERAVDDIEDYRQAFDKTMEGFNKELAKVPKGVKDGEFWKKNVAPKLKKLEDMAMKDKSAKLQEFLRVMKELLEVRKQVDAGLSSLSKDEREGIVWLERGLLGGSKALNKLHNNLITDPAIAAAKAMLSKDLASAAEKLFKQHQTDFENMTKGISELPRKGAQAVIKAQHRNLIKGQIKKDMNRVYDPKGFKDQTPANFGKGWDKAERAYRAVADTASNAKRWLGQYVVFLRDVSPRS